MLPQILKQHEARIEVSGLFDLKKDHAVFAFDVNILQLADDLIQIMSRDMRFPTMWYVRPA